MRRLMTAVACLLAASLPIAVRAQGYTGTYTAQGAQGTVILSLQEDAAGNVAGTLSGGGVSFQLEGLVYPDGLGGIVTTPQGELAFEIYLQGDTLGLYLFDLDAQGNAIVESASEIIMTRQTNAAPLPAAGGPAIGQGGGNPLAGGAAAADPLVGSFSDGSLRLELQGGAGSYQGQLSLNNQAYPVTAQGDSRNLNGSFLAGGTTYLFVASLQGDTLSLTSDGTTYILRREAAPSGSSPPASGQVLVQGQFASLTMDNALAFVEAFEFALAQAGYAYSFSEPERRQILDTLAQNFPRLGQEEQLILAKARQIWLEVQHEWASSSAADQRAFVLAVFRLALGDEAVRQLAGSGGGATAGGGCATFEDCAGAYVDGDTWSDTSNAMSCWAAAGCGGYDGTTDTFYDTTGDGY